MLKLNLKVNWWQISGLIVSIILFSWVWFMSLPEGLGEDGRRALALILLIITWWTFRVLEPVFTSLVLFLGYAVLNLATPQTMFSFTVSSLFWLVLASFLISGAVIKSGLGRRFALWLLVRWVNSYVQLIMVIYMSSLILSLFIPSPFPRTLMLMAVISLVIESANFGEKDRIAIGFIVFSSSTVTSMVFYNGDVLLNGSNASLTGYAVSWTSWLVYMTLPGITSSIILFLLQLRLFPFNGQWQINKSSLISELDSMGSLTKVERNTLIWIIGALLFWGLDFLHMIQPVWVALFIVVGLASPLFGGVLRSEDVSSQPNWSVLIFLTGAISISTVARETGLTSWLANTILGTSPSSNPYFLIAVVTLVSMVAHLAIGSAVTTMAVMVPCLVPYMSSIGWPPIATSLLIYTIVQLHYLLPFHHVTILLGSGTTGGYGERETLRFGIPMTIAVMFIVFLIEVPWWKFIGLIP